MTTKLKTNLHQLQTVGLLFLLCCSGAMAAAGQTIAPMGRDWDKTYGGERSDVLSAVLALPDGGYLLGGTSASDAGYEKTDASRGGEDYWIVRVDAQGAKLWDKTYGGADDDKLTALVPAPDGGFLLGGSSASGAGFEKTEASRGGADYWVVRIDAQGQILWDKTYGAERDNDLSALVATADGGFLLGGTSEPGQSSEKTEYGRGFLDYWVVRIDGQGVRLWDKIYGGDAGNRLHELLVLPDGGFLLGGVSWSNASLDKSQNSRGREDFWLVRTDAQGEIVWDKTYGGRFEERLNVVLPLADGGYLIGGSSESGAAQAGEHEKSENARGWHDFWAVRIDAQGTLLWEKTYGGERNDHISAITELPDGGYLLGGHSGSPAGYEKSEDGRGEATFWVVWTDDDGNLIQDKIFGPGGERLIDIRAFPDGSVFMAGHSRAWAGFDKSDTTRGGPFGGADYWLLKADDISETFGLNQIGPRRFDVPALASVDLYGNPFSESSVVSLFREDATLAPESYLFLSPYKARCLFDFAEADSGVWHLAVQFNDGLADTLYDALTLAPPEPEPEIPVEPFAPCVQIAGRPEARLGRWSSHQFTVSNPTATDRVGVPLWIALPENNASYRIQFKIADGNPLDSAWHDLGVDWTALAEPLSRRPAVLPLYIPYLRAGATARVAVSVQARNGSRSYKLRAWTNSLLSGKEFEELGAGCLYVALTAVGAEAVPEVAPEIGTLEDWRQCAVQAALDVRRDLRLLAQKMQGMRDGEHTVLTQQQFYYAAARRMFDCMNYALDDSQKTRLAEAVNAMLNYGNLVAKEKPTRYERCAMTGLGIDQKNFPCFQRELLINLNERNNIDADRDSTLSAEEAEYMRGLTEPCLFASYLFSPVCEAELDVEVVASYDPNDKVGVKGAGANGFLPELQPFKYVINYENKAEATAPAQEVFIYDTLDAEVFDLETFRFGAVGFGDTLAEPVVYPDSMAVDIDMRPAMPYVVRVTGKLDRSANAAEWYFAALDPATMRLTDDPRGGFLPPNQTSPEGQGFVFFTVAPKEELPSGTEIRNDAKIVFDVNPPIFTEPWINTLDQVRPESEAAAAQTSDTTVAIDWSGSDVGSGVAHYTIYMSVDDSAYAPVFWQTRETSGEIFAEIGRTYRFFSVATDSVNNRELRPVLPDATVLVVSRAEALDAGAGLSAAVRPNPFSGQTTFAINLTKPAKLTLEIRDLSGRLVAADTFDAPGGASRHALDGSGLSAGVYFYAITAQDGRRAAGKLIVK